MNAPKPLFRTASRGVAWSLVTSVLVIFASLLAHLALGWLLTEAEYGVYALAYASSDFLAVFRDGGVQLWLSRLTPRRFSRIEGHAFWLALGCSIATSLCLLVLAFIAGRVYGDDRITTYILILAGAFPWTAYSSVALAKLQVELKFRSMAAVKLVSALAKHSLVVSLAAMGWGPLSFALAFFGIVFLELAVYFAITQMKPWSVRPSIKWCAWTFRGSRWSLSGSFATAVLRQADYAILGLIATKAIVGYYFFAYQLAMVPLLLFSESLRRVIVPTFSQGFKGADKQKRVLEYAGVFLGGVAVVGLLGLAATAEPLEQILWHGKWAKSVWPIQFLCLAMPLHLAAFVVEMIAQSQGRFRLWTSAVFVRGIGFGVAALIAGWFGGATDPAVVAGVVAVYIAISSIAEIIVVARQLEISAGPLLQQMLPPYACAAMVWMAMSLVRLPDTYSPVLAFLIRGFAFVLATSLLWGLFSRRTIFSLLDMVAKSLGPRQSTTSYDPQSASTRS